MLDSSKPITLTRADLAFLIGEMLAVGQDRYYWRANFLKKCILRGWLNVEDAKELWDYKISERIPPGTFEIWRESEKLARASHSEM